MIQKKKLVLIVQGNELTSRRCETFLSVTRETAHQDFSLLLEMGLLRKVGRGRSIHHGLAEVDLNRRGIVR